mgnify:CR=1 FL=1
MILTAVLYARHYVIRAKPNVVMIIIDALRADKLGAYGFPLNISPEVDALAQAGTRFDLVIARSTWTRASIGSFLTSRYPRSIGIFKDKWDTLAEEELTLSEI